jgi:hypothetical protein
MNFGGIRTFASAAAVASMGQCLADEVMALQLADPSGYFESFLQPGSRAGIPKLVAPDRALVGLHLGYGSGPFSLADLRAAVPSGMTSELCVQVSSPDGRYWSINGYRPVAAAHASVRLQTRSKFDAELAAQYTADEVPIAIRATHDCDEGSKGSLIAAIPPGARTTDTLIVYLNAPGSRAGAKLLDVHENNIASGRCGPPADSTSIAFTEVCVVSLTAEVRQRASGLQITLIGEAGEPIRTKYDLILPEK